jgi:hypothetical protein
MFPWNSELLIFIDDERGLEVIGCAEGKANSGHQWAASWAEVEIFANKIGFPEHHLVIRPDSEDDSRIRKGITCRAQLVTAFAGALKESIGGRVFLEIDLRAHANPTRMENIRLAAEDLVAKLACLCPVCSTPGFWIVERVVGLPCGDCGAPTRETRAEVYGCLKCAHQHNRELNDRQYAVPSHCDYCNP